MVIESGYIFWLTQAMGLLAMFIGYLRTQKTDRKQYNLYHTYLCFPLMIQYYIVGAWFMFSLCLVGSLRTLILTTNWGWKRRAIVISLCLAIPVVGSVYTASHWVDWFLVVATVIGVGGEACKNLLHTRFAGVICNFGWLMNNLAFGSFVSAFGQLLTLVGHFQAIAAQDSRYYALVRFNFFKQKYCLK